MVPRRASRACSWMSPAAVPCPCRGVWLGPRSYRCECVEQPIRQALVGDERVTRQRILCVTDAAGERGADRSPLVVLHLQEEIPDLGWHGTDVQRPGAVGVDD